VIFIVDLRLSVSGLTTFRCYLTLREYRAISISVSILICTRDSFLRKKEQNGFVFVRATIHLVSPFSVKTNSDDWTSTAVTLHESEFTASASDDSTLQISDRDIDMRCVIKQLDARYLIWHTRHVHSRAAVCLRQVRVARPPWKNNATRHFRYPAFLILKSRKKYENAEMRRYEWLDDAMITEIRIVYVCLWLRQGEG